MLPLPEIKCIYVTSLQLICKHILNNPDNSMDQEIVQIMTVHLTNGYSDSVMDVKPQLFKKKDLPSQQLLFQEASLNDKNQTLNQEKNSEESQSDCGSSDVSFEEEILESHETALNLEIEKNESLFIIQIPQIKSKKTVVKVGSFYDNIYRLLSHMPNVGCSIVQAFHCYLQQHKNFKQFLSHIHFSYQDQVSNKLLQLSFLIWNIYRPCLEASLNKVEIMKITHDLSRKLCSYQTVFRKPKQQQLSPQKEKMRQRFIHFFVTTILFVIEGFFQNPQQHSFRDGERHVIRQFNQVASLNSQVDELEPSCRKVVKTQLQ